MRNTLMFCAVLRWPRRRDAMLLQRSCVREDRLHVQDVSGRVLRSALTGRPSHPLRMRTLARRRRRPATLSHFRRLRRRLRHQTTRDVIARRRGHVDRVGVLFHRHVQLLLLPVATSRRHCRRSLNER